MVRKDRNHDSFIRNYLCFLIPQTKEKQTTPKFLNYDEAVYQSIWRLGDLISNINQLPKLLCHHFSQA